MKIEQEIRLKKKKRRVKLYSGKCCLSSTTTSIATTTSSITSLSFTRHDTFVRYSSWAFPDFLFIRNPSGFRLAVSDLCQINPYSSACKRVRFWRSTVLVVSRSEPSNERVKATPRLPLVSGQAHGPGGSGLPKNGHPVRWTLVFPNWSKYIKKSSTWLSRHPDGAMGGLWFLRYCPKVFQSRRFCDSYRLSGAGDEFGSDVAVANGPSPLFGSDLLCLDLPATDAEAIIKNLSVLAFWVIYMTELNQSIRAIFKN